jgi:hypothetical protein
VFFLKMPHCAAPRIRANEHAFARRRSAYPFHGKRCEKNHERGAAANRDAFEG